MDLYPARVALAVTSLTYRRLDYLIRSGFFTPDLPADGKGTARAFSFRDLLALKCVAALRDAGVSLQAVRKVDRALRDYGRDWAGARLAVVGRGASREVYLDTHDGLLALLARPGQSAWAVVLDVGRLAAEVTAAVKRLEVAA